METEGFSGFVDVGSLIGGLKGLDSEESKFRGRNMGSSLKIKNKHRTAA